jgi:O-antigen/teichoic acid export membrane protein
LASIKRNVVASYVSQIYMVAIGIVLMPTYLRFMGAESYGLIGFYSMLQGWFMLLDVGLTPTMIRETARFRGGALDALKLRRFVKAIEGIFYAVGTLAAVLMIAGSHSIATGWLKVHTLPIVEVRNAIVLIAAIISMRWVSSVYKGAVNGFERLVWLGGFNIAIATLRFVIVIPVIVLVGATPTVFFSYQLIIAIIEVASLHIKSHRLLPQIPLGAEIGWNLSPLKGTLRFSLIIAITSSAWIVVTQTDKLLLSKLLPLSDYAYFTLAVLVAGGVNLLGGPISSALIPRMVTLQEAGDEAGMMLLYRNATQAVAVIAVPAALILACFSKQILMAWTGSQIVSQAAAPVLTMYALGNGILAISSFPYFLQFAKGDLKLHLIGSGLFVVTLIPSLIWGTMHYGTVGAGYAWLLANALYLVFWVPMVHRRFVKGLHRVWLFNDVAAIVVMSSACALLIRHFFVNWPENRIHVAVLLVLYSSVLVFVAAAASSWVRQIFLRRGWIRVLYLQRPSRVI